MINTKEEVIKFAIDSVKIYFADCDIFKVEKTQIDERCLKHKHLVFIELSWIRSRFAPTDINGNKSKNVAVKVIVKEQRDGELSCLKISRCDISEYFLNKYY